MAQGDIHQCMQHTCNSLHRMRKGVSDAMASATIQMQHVEWGLNDLSKGLRDSCTEYLKALKQMREADKYHTAAMERAGTARQGQISEGRRLLMNLNSEPEADDGLDGPDF